MKIHKKLPALLYAGCGFSLFLVMLVGATSLFFSERQKQKEKTIAHTYRVLENVHSVYHHLYEMGMDKQRYRSTGVAMFFQSYHNHSDSLLDDLSALNMLVADNPAQAAKIRQLRLQINDLLNFWQQEDINLKNSDAGSLLKVTWSEKEKVDNIRLEITAISDIEREGLKQSEDGNVWLRQRTEFAIVAGTLLILVLVCFLIYFILQELRTRIDAYQHEKEISQLKSNFVSLASHEFRTPLGSILLSVSLIEKYIKLHDTDNACKHSQKIKTGVNNLKCILEDFLSLEKLDAGRMKAVINPFDLVELCEDIIDEMQHTAGPGQTLRFRHTGAIRIVNLDRNLMRNAIINLINNSIKYAGDIAIIVLETNIKDNHVVISIKDNGAGIAEHEQKELFTPFFRVNNTGNIPGTGLGLSIVSRYVKLMHGAISFSSVPYKETCFKMSFLNAL